MIISKIIQAIDTHTAGEPARLIIGGISDIPGKNMAEKKQYLIEHCDHLRTGLMHEPRGHNAMFGAFILPPTVEEADFGVIFMDGGGYLNMCGHNTIAVVTATVETGMIEVKKGAKEVKVVLETPAGLVHTTAKLNQDCKVEEVSFKNVESFLYKENVKLKAPGIGEITFDIAFGGGFFIIVDVKELGLKVEVSNLSKLSKLAMSILKLANEKIIVEHPTLAHIKSIDLVEIFDAPTHPEATYKNVVIFGDGQVDRSPCGTGTSAKIATLYAKGQLKADEIFVHESILGTLFRGKIVETGKKIGDFDAIIPEISGSAYITGFANFLFDPQDPLVNGFLLS